MLWINFRFPKTVTTYFHIRRQAVGMLRNFLLVNTFIHHFYVLSKEFWFNFQFHCNPDEKPLIFEKDLTDLAFLCQIYIRTSIFRICWHIFHDNHHCCVFLNWKHFVFNEKLTINRNILPFDALFFPGLVQVHCDIQLITKAKFFHN